MGTPIYDKMVAERAAKKSDPKKAPANKAVPAGKLVLSRDANGRTVSNEAKPKPAKAKTTALAKSPATTAKAKPLKAKKGPSGR